MEKRLILIPSVVLLGVFNFAIPAHAYLDAGTGSMLLQLILGGVAGLVVIMKLYWQKFRSFFRKSNPNKIEEGLSQRESE